MLSYKIIFHLLVSAFQLTNSGSQDLFLSLCSGFKLGSVGYKVSALNPVLSFCPHLIFKSIYIKCMFYFQEEIGNKIVFLIYIKYISYIWGFIQNANFTKSQCSL